MGQLGFGVMLGMLSGNEDSANAYREAMGKVISSIKMECDCLEIDFTDGTGLTLSDDGQSCCESRYMSTDDDLKPFVGATLGSAEVRDGGGQESEYGDCHETAFLVIETSAGSFTCVTHNEHNGYYGGFSIRAHARGAK